MAQSGVELLGRFGVGSFLRAVYARSAVWPAKRIGHVAGHENFAFLQRRMAIGDVYRCQFFQSGSTSREFGAVSVLEGNAECLRHPHAAIVRRTASDADNDPARAALQMGKITWCVGAAGLASASWDGCVNSDRASARGVSKGSM